MTITNNQNLLRWILIFTSFVIISLILWNTYVFFQHFKAEESVKMQNFSLAQGELGNIEVLEGNISDFPLTVVQSNTTTPMILINKNGEISVRNINEEVTKDSVYIRKLIQKFESENEPVSVMFNDETLQTIYYGNSPLLNKLKYYPLALLLIIFLFGAVVYFFYRSSQNAAQNKLWSGMAKETAHQIGTPLSSLIGWTELLKSENVNPDHIKEMEKDVNRLQTITDRFSKIGSVPTLEPTDIVSATKEAYDYLKARSSKLIAFSFEAPNTSINVDLNNQLYGWTIENLVKNAIDAMKGEGEIKLEVISHDTFVNVLVSDTGKGIQKKNYKKIFEPGYTSRKRGWGLGLSLAKRIIEDYHNGKIKVLHSELKKGTIMQITLKTL